MIEYEVTVHVDAAIADEYRGWLHEHVRQMLALPGFVQATVWQVIDPTPPAGQITYCARYQLDDADALSHYLGNYAPSMRAAGENRFGSRFRASRRILAPLEIAS